MVKCSTFYVAKISQKQFCQPCFSSPKSDVLETDWALCLPFIQSFIYLFYLFDVFRKQQLPFTFGDELIQLVLNNLVAQKSSHVLHEHF